MNKTTHDLFNENLQHFNKIDDLVDHLQFMIVLNAALLQGICGYQFVDEMFCNRAQEIKPLVIRPDGSGNLFVDLSATRTDEKPTKLN